MCGCLEMTFGHSGEEFGADHFPLLAPPACSAFLTLAHLLSPQSVLSLGQAGVHTLWECCKHSAAASQSATLQPHSRIGARTLSH